MAQLQLPAAAAATASTMATYQHSTHSTPSPSRRQVTHTTQASSTVGSTAAVQVSMGSTLQTTPGAAAVANGTHRAAPAVAGACQLISHMAINSSSSSSKLLQLPATTGVPLEVSRLVLLSGQQQLAVQQAAHLACWSLHIKLLLQKSS